MVAITGAAKPQFDAAALKMKERTVLVDSSMDDGGWHVRPPFHETHRAALLALIQGCPELDRLGVYYDPHMTSEQGRKQEDVGVFDLAIKRWRLRLNWTTGWKSNGIPPRHIAVAYEGEPVGVIGPYATIRTCWRCGLHGYRDEERKSPWVIPGVPCPRCGGVDWWGVKRSHVINPMTGRPFNIHQDELRIDCKEFYEDKVGLKINGSVMSAESEERKRKARIRREKESTQ